MVLVHLILQHNYVQYFLFKETSNPANIIHKSRLLLEILRNIMLRPQQIKFNIFKLFPLIIIMPQNLEFCLPGGYAVHNYFGRANTQKGYKEGKEIVF